MATVDDLTHAQLTSLTGPQIEEIEANPEKLDEILAQNGTTDKEDTTSNTDTTSTDTSKQEGKDSAANGVDDQVTTDKEDDPVVLNKSGKGTIPYATHAGLRQDKAKLTEDNQTLTTQNETLTKERDEAVAKSETLAQAKVDAEATGTSADIAKADKEFETYMESLKEDFPEQHAMFSHLLSENKRLETSLSEKIEATTETAKKAVTEENQRLSLEDLQVQADEAIENNSDLAHWKEHDPVAYAEAGRQDNALRNDPDWRDKTFEERYVEAVRVTRFKLPNASIPKLTEAETAAANKKVATEKVGKTTERQITTLSDIKGASGVSLSKQEELDNMDGLDLTAKILAMSPEDQAKFRSEGDV